MGNRLPRAASRRFSAAALAVAAGLVAATLIVLVEKPRAELAAAEEVNSRIREQLYTPILRGRGQAQLLAANSEVREGIAERNRLRLRRALRQALAQMQLSYAGVLLPDGTPYFWLPDEERSAPIVASRLPIEHELRTVAILEYGTMLTEEFLRELADRLATDVTLFAPDGRSLAPAGSELPAPTGAGRADRQLSVDLVNLTRGFGYSYLRSPERSDDTSAPVIAIVGFRVPPATAAAARIRRERDLLLGVIAVGVVLVVARDVRRRRQHRPPEQPAAAFTPIPNPYIVGNAIRTADMFFGREDDFQFARQKLASEQAGVVLVFCGERRSGKTSILFQILNGRLGDRFVPVLIDMQYFAAISTDRDFYRNVFREVVRTCYPESEHGRHMTRVDAPSDSKAQAFELALNEVIAAHPDKCLLFLFDEYEILEAKIDRGELSKNLIPFLAGLLERNRRLAFIFTGSQNLEERATHHWRVMLGKSLYRKISYLTARDTERLIRQPVEGTVDYDNEAVARIGRLTSGQPFYTQVICQNLIDRLNEVRRRVVSAEDVTAIVDGIVDNPLPQMIYFWDSLPPDEQVALSLLAETLGDSASRAAVSHLMTGAAEKGVPVSCDAPTLEGALERLFEKELLDKSPARAFQYRIDLLRHWIRRTHSIWQVVKEARSGSNARA